MKKCLALLFIAIVSFLPAQDLRLVDSLEQSLKTAGDKDKVKALVYLSQQYFAVDNAKVRSYLARSISISRKSNFPDGIANSYNMLGILYASLGKPDSAIACLDSSAHIHRRLGHKLGEASALGNIGGIYQGMGNLEKALIYHFKCLALYEALGNETGIATVQSNIAGIYEVQGKPEGAYKWYNKALAINLATGNKRNEANNRDNLSMVLRKLGRKGESAAESDRALAIFDSLGLKENVGDVYINLGTVMREEGDNEKAYYYFTEALKRYREVGSEQKSVQVNGFFADYYYRKKDFAKSIEWNLKFLESARRTKAVNLERDASLALAASYAAVRKFDLAYDYMKRVTELNKDLLSEQSARQMNELMVKYETEKKENENLRLHQENEIQDLQLTRGRYLTGALALLTVLALLVAILLVRQSRFRAEQKNMQLEQKLLRSQMNPHFIFNSLQAIQNYILSHNQKDAVKYLSSFANITRSVLENSRMDLIPLRKEISLLENYLQLQKLRFGNRFNYRIHVDPVLDVEAIDLPPMLSQPFIENALEHGLRDVESGGEIDVFFALKDGNLLLRVIDNGRGIQPSDSSVKQRQSLALAITRERVELMNRNRRRKATFTIGDAFPAADRKGVEVSFSIPL